MPDEQTVLGILMQQDADLNQPGDDERDASWIRISQAIDTIEQERGTSSQAFPRIDPLVPVPDEDWNPKTVFNTRTPPRSSWQFPSRRLAVAMFAVFVAVAVFLAGALYLQSSGILSGPGITELTDDPIPMADPNSPLPSLQELLVFLSDTDSQQLTTLAKMTPDEQKRLLQDLSVNNCMVLSQTGQSARKGTSYWIARKLAGDDSRMLVLIGREKAGESGWQVIYQLIPRTSDVPSGKALDDYFDQQLKKRRA